MKVRDLCVCDVAAATRETNLSRAGALMRKYNIGAVPVVDRNDRVIGMVTDRDIALELSRRNAPASEIFVDEIMSEKVAAVDREDDVQIALHQMARHKVRRLPVVDEDDTLQGILSIDDIFCHAVEQGEGKGKKIPYEDLVETLGAIAQEYRGESGAVKKGVHARGRAVEEEPEVEEEHRGRSRLIRAESERGRQARFERTR
ncbi:MAG: CBS domain-containing protein [Planctomycetes bacterium]|nr:CBS domain-containing protein [Planctomycetota bacterium]